MSRKTNASAAELARRIEQHLPVFARPTLEQLIAAVQRETRAQAAHDRTPTTDKPPVAETFRQLREQFGAYYDDVPTPQMSAGEAHPAHD